MTDSFFWRGSVPQHIVARTTRTKTGTETTTTSTSKTTRVEGIGFSSGFRGRGGGGFDYDGEEETIGSERDNISGITTFSWKNRKRKLFRADDTRLFGRNDQINQLQEHLQTLLHNRSNSSNNSSHLILVEGAQGVGKTRLVQSSLREPAVEKAHGYFVEGRFDNVASHGWPHAGLISALTDLIDLLVGEPQRVKEQIKERLQRTLTNHEIRQLGHVLFNISYLVQVSREPQQQQQQKQKQAETYHKSPLITEEPSVSLNSYKLLYLITGFLNSVQKPIVLFIDDVHWADPETLELLGRLRSNSLLLVVTYCTEYRDTVHTEMGLTDTSLYNDESDLQDKDAIKNNNNKSTAVCPNRKHSLIRVHNLSLEYVIEYLQNATKRDDVQELAEIVLDKTNGNPHYIQEFLDLVVQSGEDFIRISDDSLNAEEDSPPDGVQQQNKQKQQQRTHFAGEDISIQWDLELLRSKTDKTTNVVDLILESKLQLLSKDTEQLLILATHLGSNFSNLTLEFISDQMDVPFDLNPALDVGLLEEISANNNNNNTHDKSKSKSKANKKNKPLRYKFSHDRIWKIFAAASTDGMKVVVGRFLITGEEGMEVPYHCLDDLKSLGVKCLNRISNKEDLLTKEDLQNMAEQNFLLGKLAMSKASPRLASESFEMGLSCFNSMVDDEEPLPSSMLLLKSELMNTLARTKFLLGHHDEALRLAEKVLSEANHNNDKYEAFRIKLDSLVGSGRLDEAVEEGCSISTLLGEPLSIQPNKLAVGREFMKTRKLLANKSDSQLLDRPMREHPTTSSLLRVWGALLIPAYAQKRTNLVGIVSMRTICRSMKYGCTSFVAVAFCVYGSMLAKMGNHDESYRFGKLAMAALRLFPSEELECRVVVSAQCMILHLREPLRGNLSDMKSYYMNGIKSGADLYTLSCGSAALKAGFHCGINLEELSCGMEEYLLDAARFNKLKASTVVTVEAYHLLITFLCGDEGLTDVIAKEEKLKKEAASRNDDTVTTVIATVQLFRLAFLSKSTEEGVSLVRFIEKEYSPQSQIHFLAHFVSFYQAFALYKHYHWAGGIFLRNEAKKFKKRLDILADGGCVNITVPRKIIEGEELVAQGKEMEATSVFIEAADLAVNAQLTHMAALAYERAGMTRKDMDDGRKEARQLINKAVELYNDWGALEKATRLESEHFVLLFPLRKSD
mmetsp:Transcript_35527/g.50378  ORF Transcript_35527/g.50378 Transcript_35527/m.50378 type:complete len:1188 (+) Transcript_35527:62-3625(+)|eukprot:CAMPEP_0202445896 /NCGR_PEP_ID=MMETSP1360-20130828/4613_1 /ASSEMBLY_ACC=CAM_ASM_000848 /TAXON_ID=515479 /ORGANISM="Licmophora paradoxa, Strain CCMP2313" /LENGTH=1187 /DNA_ID=CAMNT_0049062303 /DNA_START=25 /DNA_END=3588 /DNA_ORIENTATION=+